MNSTPGSRLNHPPLDEQPPAEPQPAEPPPDEPARRTSRWLPGVAVSSVLAAYALIIFGSHVRVTESGMGCPDWPLCDGQIGPIYEFHALMEQTHRYLAAVVTVLVLATAILALRDRAPSRSLPASATLRPALFTVGVIVAQIALGAVTVMTSNAAPTVAAHLLAGLAMLGGATVTAVCALVPRRAGPGRRLGMVGWVAIGAATVLFLTGSLVINAQAEQACASFPLCPADQPGALVWLHLIHRAVAMLAGIALLAFATHAWRRWSVIPGARALAATTVALVVATASLGIASALLLAPPNVQDLHLAGAAAVLVTSVALAALGWLTGADCPAHRPTTEPPMHRAAASADLGRDAG